MRIFPLIFLLAFSAHAQFTRTSAFVAASQPRASAASFNPTNDIWTVYSDYWPENFTTNGSIVSLTDSWSGKDLRNSAASTGGQKKDSRLDGHPVMSYDGSTQFFTNLVNSIAPPFEIWMAVCVSNFNVVNPILWVDSAGSGSENYLYRNSGSYATVGGSFAAWQTNEWVLLNWQVLNTGTGTNAIWTNGVVAQSVQGTVATQNSLMLGRLIGATRHLQFLHGRILIYQGKIPGTNATGRSDVRAWFTNYYPTLTH